MSSFLFELPTTGAISFADIVADPGGAYTLQLAEATQARANVRAALKEAKRTDGEKDYLRLVKVPPIFRSDVLPPSRTDARAQTLDDYLPHLAGVSACVDAGALVIAHPPPSMPAARRLRCAHRAQASAGGRSSPRTCCTTRHA
jgi:hypothetical protein